MLTRRHYVAIANIIRRSESKEKIINMLSRYFYKDNPRFNPDKFVQACKGEEGGDYD